MKGILSQPLDAASYRRLVDAWSDPLLSLAKIVDRFRVTPKDVKELKRVLGSRPAFLAREVALVEAAPAARAKGRCQVMHGLTVQQPFATAIALSDPRELGEKGKSIENRGWEPWPKIIGTHIAIHAGVRASQDGDMLEAGRLLYGEMLIAEAKTWVSRVAAGRGMILCVARVSGFARNRRDLRESQRRWKVDGSVGWQLDDVLALPEPILLRGQQGLWNVTPDIEKKIRAQVSF